MNSLTSKIIVICFFVGGMTLGFLSKNNSKPAAKAPVVVSGSDVCNYCRNQLIDQMAVTAIQAKKIEISNNGNEYLFVLKSQKKIPVPKATLVVENIKGLK